MTRNALYLACAVMFCTAHAAYADTTANSSSGSTSGSTSVGIGQGGGSSLNNIGTSANSSATTNSNSSSVGGIGSANAMGGSSNVNVSVTMPTMTASTGAGTGTSGGAGADVTSKAATGPGSSAYDTRATVDYNQSSYSVRTTPAIAAPGLTTTLSDTCMGSTSFGLSVTGFGVTGGTTQVDQACVRRLDAREFRAMGLTDVALALLCQSDANRKAVEATGHLCPGTTAPLAKAPKAPEAPQYSDDEKYRDPFVRARLGLPVPETGAQSQSSGVPANAPSARDAHNDIAAVKTSPVTSHSIEVSLLK
ncbi:hypothetical protein VOM14_19910 [Paraburkholderia sp. MPAMCS5]|uniref:hypothetical protein n=1 Tax=Paraburkholderia sp. MPAMCS5 TaxID=3112563 RepID=UPI002E177A3C|nr:hypothetical protein [Paraburkholderia sp. MPAMCS5]